MLRKVGGGGPVITTISIVLLGLMPLILLRLKEYKMRAHNRFLS